MVNATDNLLMTSEAGLLRKHAYLVIAYNNWEILSRQIKLLDSEYNDIYLLIDSKSQDFKPSCLPSCSKSKLVLAERRPIYWAEYSQVDALLDLIELAQTTAGKDGAYVYSYFHFFSGTDLPLKSNKFIYDFCECEGKNFIGIIDKEYWYSVKRVRFYWPLLDNAYYKKCKSLKAFTRVLAAVQHLVRINRLKGQNLVIYNGWDWASITGELATYLVGQREWIEKTFRLTLCPSELWLHTIVLNRGFRGSLHCIDNLREGSMRFIDWERGKPYAWGGSSGDFRTLVDSPYLFARKFDESQMWLVEKIFDHVSRENKC